MSMGGRFVKLETLMQGAFKLYGHDIVDAQSNIRDLGPPPGSSGVMKYNKDRNKQVKSTKARRKAKGNGTEQSAGPHVDSQAEHHAILWKNTNVYPHNAGKYIHANRAAVYNSFSHLGPASFQMEVSAWAGFSKLSNFNPELSGKTQPYPWQAHHLIPGEAFYAEDFNGSPVFDKPENFDILLQTAYDVDHGHNMMILPSKAWAVPVHALLQHANNHNNYSLDVMTGMKLIDDQIDTLRGQDKPHEAIVANVFKELQNLESDLWDLLVEESRNAVRGAAEGQLYKGSWTRFKTQKGKEYGSWPALW